MKIARVLLAGILVLGTTLALASPRSLITHNRTSFQSNAFTDGTIPSAYPTPKGQDGSVLWMLVRLACIGHTTNGQCSAVVKVATDTANPVDVAKLSMNLESGVITLLESYTTAYRVIIHSNPGEVTIAE